MLAILGDNRSSLIDGRNIPAEVEKNFNCGVQAAVLLQDEAT
jgi:hypothetical protein